MLVKNWRDVLRRAYSIRLMIIAAILSGVEVALPLLDGLLPIPPGVFAALSGLTVAAAFVARVCAQKGLSDE
ncbi:hypothetical protein C5748_17145 [Phyllobacterium phragmitis]|uniref:Uncharacterized protein n=1 Tax=Phyllobacterium phragmitis TaxID=2670329 RepID=A0A2S9INV0_9HYPH|nr:hypothetical protein [Phyllobacterium phragmitis]PRD42191.1 hypothetical protein C5748_17145 [Phyllobacterium phragmitis]